MQYFLFQGYVDASPEDVFEETVIKVEETPRWNTTVQECIVSFLCGTLTNGYKSGGQIWANDAFETQKIFLGL